MKAAELLSRAADLIWPRRCVFCGEILRTEEPVCGRCMEKLPFFTPDAKPHPVPLTEGCVSVLRYRDAVRDSVLRMKFHGAWHYARAYAGLMAAVLAAHEWTDFDAVTYVPSRRRSDRPYNPAELIARELCSRLDLSPPQALLRKVRRNRRQSGLEASARAANVLGVFALTPAAAVSGKRILLVDDVLTTGATLSECARILRNGGAETVSCVTLARTEK